MLTYLLMGRERLISYSVHELPNPPGDRVERAEQLVFVRDGFQFSAFLLAPLWLALHGVWLGLLAYLLAAGAVLSLASAFGVPAFATALVLLALHLILGSEADEIYRAHLAARGWNNIGHVTGTGALDCERRFFDNWLPTMPPPAPGPTPVQKLGAGASLGRSILGNMLAPLRRK